ncbi:MAG: phosphodiester glycosidase family protein [Oscillospiraceae bacterium]|nr:phosphodiester glycosidase family protein [Oscillospiraceae bacterium]
MSGKFSWSLVYALLLAAFTAYVLLDTFVITRVYALVPPTQSIAPAVTPEASVSADTYDSGGVRITVAEYRVYDTSIYVADVTVPSADVLKTAFARQSYGRNVTEKTSAIAQEVDAILAINGDYYGAQNDGYVLRGGVLYRDTVSAGQEDLVIWDDGSFSIITEGEDAAAAELLAQGAEQILSFGPALVEDGAVAVTEADEVGKAKSSNPRTAIGIVGPLHYVFVVSDGRTEESEGLSLYQLAVFLQELGVSTAYNLDGGGSSTMYFNGAVVNHPTTDGRSIKERSVSDIVYIGA